MSSFRRVLLIAFTGIFAGCALGADDVGEDLPPANPALADKTVPRCDRLGDLAAPADFLRTKALSPASVGRVEVQIVSGEISRVAGHRCLLTEPQGFCLDGCADWYECGGCDVELRRATNGPYQLTGLSDARECADIRAEYQHPGD